MCLAVMRAERLSAVSAAELLQDLIHLHLATGTARIHEEFCKLKHLTRLAAVNAPIKVT